MIEDWHNCSSRHSRRESPRRAPRKSLPRWCAIQPRCEWPAQVIPSAAVRDSGHADSIDRPRLSRRAGIGWTQCLGARRMEPEARGGSPWVFFLAPVIAFRDEADVPLLRTSAGALPSTPI